MPPGRCAVLPTGRIIELVALNAATALAFVLPSPKLVVFVVALT